MFKYFGILSYIVAIVSIILCYFIAGELMLSEGFVLSDFGVDIRTSAIFNLGLIFTGVIHFFYLRYLFKSFKISFYTRLFFVLAIIGLIGVGLVTYTFNRPLHWILAGFFFFGYPLASALMGVELKKKYPKFGMLISISIFTAVIFFVTFIYVTPRAVAEVLLVVLLSSLVLIPTFVKSKNS